MFILIFIVACSIKCCFALTLRHIIPYILCSIINKLAVMAHLDAICGNLKVLTAVVVNYMYVIQLSRVV